MAFVFRTARFRSENGNIHLGPGSYNIDNALRKRPAKALVPFNSTSARLLSDTSTSDTPGPGSYIPVHLDPPDSAQHAASSSFASNTSRFSYLYKPSSEANAPVLTHPDWTRSIRQQKRTRRAQTVAWCRVGTAPSIPARNQSHGYSQDGYGDLHPRPATTKIRSGVGNDTAGPGDYDVDDRALRVVRTCDFGRSTSKRSATAAPTSAATGPYLGPQPWIAAKTKPSAAFASNTKRFDNRRRDDLPAPGQYDPYPDRIVHESGSSASKTHQSFSKQVGRDKLPRTEAETPGVGSYNVQANSSFKSASELEKRRKALCLKDQAPFQSQAPRFRSGSSSETPGPGAYDVHQPAIIDPELEAYKSAKRSAFGVGTERFRDDKKNDVPGPGEYRIIGAPEPRYKSGRTSSFFQSHSKRFVDPRPDDGPGPNTYQKIPDWRKSPKIRSKTAAFLSSQKSARCETKAADTPGPGAYVLPSRSASRTTAAGAALRFTAKRFADGHDDRPGVGTYDLISHDSLLKRSFNITISDEYQ